MLFALGVGMVVNRVLKNFGVTSFVNAKVDEVIPPQIANDSEPVEEPSDVPIVIDTDLEPVDVSIETQVHTLKLEVQGLEREIADDDVDGLRNLVNNYQGTATSRFQELDTFIQSSLGDVYNYISTELQKVNSSLETISTGSSTSIGSSPDVGSVLTSVELVQGLFQHHTDNDLSTQLDWAPYGGLLPRVYASSSSPGFKVRVVSSLDKQCTVSSNGVFYRSENGTRWCNTVHFELSIGNTGYLTLRTKWNDLDNHLTNPSLQDMNLVRLKLPHVWRLIAAYGPTILEIDEDYLFSAEDVVDWLHVAPEGSHFLINKDGPELGRLLSSDTTFQVLISQFETHGFINQDLISGVNGKMSISEHARLMDLWMTREGIDDSTIDIRGPSNWLIGRNNISTKVEQVDYKTWRTLTESLPGMTTPYPYWILTTYKRRIEDAISSDKHIYPLIAVQSPDYPRWDDARVDFFVASELSKGVETILFTDLLSFDLPVERDL